MQSLHHLKIATKIVFLSLFFVTPFLQNCTTNEPLSNDSVEGIEFSDFNNFPDTPFLNLNFNLPNSDSRKLLVENKFETANKTLYTRPSDSTSLVLNTEDYLTEFKIYLKSAFYLDHNQELFDFLSDKSTKTIGNNQFAEMTFETANNSFKLTYFTTINFIRIRCQMQSKHSG